MSKQIGLNSRLYYNSGTFATPVWVNLKNCGDIAVSDTMAEADVSTRGSGGNLPMQSEPAQRTIEVTWSMIYDPLDTLGFIAIQTRYLSQTLTELAFSDGDIVTAGTKYTRAEMKIFDFSNESTLAGPNKFAVRAKPCWSANSPSSVVVP